MTLETDSACLLRVLCCVVYYKNFLMGVAYQQVFANARIKAIENVWQRLLDPNLIYVRLDYNVSIQREKKAKL